VGVDSLRIERLRIVGGCLGGRPGPRERAWREWCFIRAVLSQLWRQFAVLTVLLVLGAFLFRAFEPERGHTLVRGIYYTWSLVFAEPPEDFPTSRVLQAMFFLVPLVGLTVIVDAIVEFAGLLRDRQRSERRWCRIMASGMSDHIVLVGLGRLGYRTFALLRRLGERVVVIEINPQNQFLEDVRRDGSPLLVGDARGELLLRDANIERARCIILATTDDLANLEIALDAKRLSPLIRVVMRMFDQNMADKVKEGFDIQIAMSQAAISAPTFALKAIEPSIVGGVVVGDRLVVSIRAAVREGGPLVGRTVGEVIEGFGCGVVERRGDGDVWLFPSPRMTLQAGDEVLLEGPYERVSELRRLVDGVEVVRAL
jgi:voltage-gated potassium channel